MPVKAPKIDPRTYDDIVEETAKLVEQNTNKNWRQPSPGEKADAGMALIHVFARMTSLLIDRLNQVPEKNFLAFLELIGMRLLSPQPARVPLTFLPAAGTAMNTFIRVSAGTQAAAPPPEGEEEEIIFETDRDLVLTTSKLKAVFTIDPKTDCFADCTSQATGARDESFPAFSGSRPIEHNLYLAHDGIFTLGGSKTVTFESSDQDKLQAFEPAWEYWNGNDWVPLKVGYEFKEKSAETQNVESEHKEKIRTVAIVNPPAPSMVKVNGQEHAWLRAQLKPPKDPPRIQKITMDFTVKPGSLELDAGFFNTVALDLSKDFLPFGERPRFNDTLYLASKEVFGNSGARVTIDVKLSDPEAVKPSNDLEIVWEASSGTSWIEIGRFTSENSSSGENVFKFQDNTQAFTKIEKKVTFTIPQKMSPGEVNGATNYWIRARIVKGNYGTEPVYKTEVYTRKDEQLKDYTVYETKMEGGFHPPRIASVKLGFQRKGVPLASCLTDNDFIYVNRIDEAGNIEKPFLPFTPSIDTLPSLYLGFDQPFANRLVSIYAHVEPISFEETEKNSTIEAGPAQVSWEYSSSSKDGWTRLGVEDGTRGLAEPGLITFIGPGDFAARPKFGLDRELYWIRAQLKKGKFLSPPKLRQLLTNTTWASQSTSVQNEILGSSNGQPEQIFAMMKAPVLLDPRIEVCEKEMPSAIEQGDIKVEPGEEKPSPETDSSLAPFEHWVVWHAVANFHGSGPQDRHYVIDYQKGEVHFGDGKRGRVPPLGRGNIRAALYRTGGGSKGNLPAGAITQLKSAVAYVAGITNHYAATGGAEGQTLEHVKRFGPRTIRHRNRAVTRQDVEDLAYGASTDVARARAIAPRYDPINQKWWDTIDKKWIQESEDEANDVRVREAGKIELIIVPRIDDPDDHQPKPSLGLINHVRKHIFACCVPTVNLELRGADWIAVTVTADIVPISVQAGINLKQKVTHALQHFLHPLSGGFDHQGWPFGRQPHDSDVYALIESINGVDYVQSLNVVKEPAINDLVWKQMDSFLVYSGSHKITVNFPGKGN